MRRRLRMRAALAGPASVLLACVLGLSARADEVPLPGPVVEGAVVKKSGDPDASTGPTEPLWEFGLGLATVRFADYRGSDQSSTYVLPLPLFVYRGQFLRADREGARAIFFDGQRAVVDLSLGASVPTKSKDNDAREGMPNLPGTVEIGPNVTVELWQSDSRRLKLNLRLPVREAITIQTSPKPIGVTFSPNLNLDVTEIAGRWNLGLLAGPLWSDRRYNEHFYSVAPEFATATRPQYDAPGGFAGWRATTAFSGRVGNFWLGGFLRWDDLHGASFLPSPLVRRDNSLTAGFGVSWVFAASSQRVRADD